MFTGIVQTQGKIRTLTPNDFGARLTVERGQLTPGSSPGSSPETSPQAIPIAHGDSICVSGVCLTAVEITDDSLSFDVIAETLRMTKLGDLTEGDAVNLEPAVTPNQPLGGHFMQGHVDGVGQIVRIVDSSSEWRTTVRPPADVMPFIVPKGSVAIDGVSLTIASVAADTFDVALIPETLSRTTLGHQREGTRVNLEADILSKTVVHYLRRTAVEAKAADPKDVGVTMDTLRVAGFAK